jgi:Helix-hairpin-helix motif
MSYRILFRTFLYCALAVGTISAQRKPATPPSTLVDLNSASAPEMERELAIDPATAEKIIAHRPYRSMSELPGAGISPDVVKLISSKAIIRPLRGQPSTMAAVPPAPPNMVWVDTDKKVYYHSGASQYQTTRHGKLMTETEAQKEGFKPGQ